MSRIYHFEEGHSTQRNDNIYIKEHILWQHLLFP